MMTSITLQGITVQESEHEVDEERGVIERRLVRKANMVKYGNFFKLHREKFKSFQAETTDYLILEEIIFFPVHWTQSCHKMSEN